MLTYWGAKEQLNDKCFSKRHSFHIQQQIFLFCGQKISLAKLLQRITGNLGNDKEVEELKQEQENTDDLEKYIYVI